MRFKKITVNLDKRSYGVFLGRDLIDQCGKILRGLDLGSDAVVISNPRVAGLFKKRLATSLKQNGISCRFVLVPDSEKAKSWKIAGKILSNISRHDVNKRIFIIALGGGVVGDLAGFVASVYKRGTAYVQVPTTLLAQIDSSVGGKVAVDLDVGKNLAGSFHQPKAVIVDTGVLKSLTVRQVRNGLAEIIKYGIIRDLSLFTYIEKNLDRILALDDDAIEHVIARSIKIKSDIVSKDEYDRDGVRAVLNFGHTIGHAIEAAGGYSDRYNHGEAVALGMVAASMIANDLGMTDNNTALRITGLIKRSGLPTYLTCVAPVRIFSAHLHDKKFTGSRNRFILFRNIGKAEIFEGVPNKMVRAAIKGLTRKVR